MQLSTSQFLGQRQQFVVTAQLQQAIHLLQMNNTDLQSFVDSEAEENPFLTIKREKSESSYAPSLPSSRSSGSADFDYISMMAEAPAPSLYAHISAQFDVMFENPAERMLAEQFLEAIEPSGWLGETLEDIAFRSGVSMDAAEDMLLRVQQVEPAGLFARSLSECLALQAQEKGWMSPLFLAVLKNLPLLAKADLKGLTKACKCSTEELRDVLKLVRGLNPKPGADFDMSDTVQRAPDLLVSRGDAGWVVDLNRSTLPSIIVEEASAKIKTKKAEDNDYIGERLSLARWLRRAVEYRNNTTLAVGAEIVRRQAEFLAHGPSHLRPMILRDVAEAIGVHESTVSRVTSNILIATPQGTFPLKMFFNAALGKQGDDEAGSSAAIRFRIQKLVKEEQPDAPLSDDAIAKIVSDEGVPLARRTVAKYREMLSIPSSFERRRQNALVGAA